MDQNRQVREGLCLEGAYAGQALVQNNPQGVDVRARVQTALAPNLLGRHVVRRAQGRAFLSELQAAGLLSVELRDAEIQNFDEGTTVRAFGDEQIVGLEV